MVKAHLVNHTHWDREWYFTTMDAQVLSEQLFTEVINELEKNKSSNFCLDGQISIVDEYIAIHPENLSRIQNLVKEGRLFLGPWYTQTDALLPDSESIIRNLALGMLETKKKYGEPMKIGYLPDTFGFNAQMPTIFHQVGIDNMFFWRGTNFDIQTNSVYFKWHGLGDKEILAINFPFGYFTGQITPESKQNIQEFVEKRYDSAVKFQSEHGQHDDVLMPSGIDQMNIVKNMEDTVKLLNEHSQYETVIDTYPGFLELIRQKKETLPNYSGELRLPTYARVHRTIGSVRYKIKQQNYLLEQKILKRIEPLVVMGHKIGIDIGNGLLIKLWHKLLECQAHDTLGGSISDNVAVDVRHRFKEANELADGIENLIQKKIADYLGLTNKQILIFNTDAHKFDGKKVVNVVVPTKKIKLSRMSNQEIISAKYHSARQNIMTMTSKGQEFIDEPAYYELAIEGNITLLPMSYTVLDIEDTDSELVSSSLRNSESSITSGNYTLEFVQGNIALFNGKEKINDVISLVDSANDGDTYDYSPLFGDEEKKLSFKTSKVLESSNGNVLILNGSARIPKNLENRMGQDPDKGLIKYELHLKFNNDQQIESHLEIDNEVESHRIRVCFNTSILSDVAIAQIQAGYVRTQNKKIDDDWKTKFVEKPVNLYNFDKTVSVSTEGKHFTFWGDGQKEYELKNNQLFITLMATTGQLGKSNLEWRPGRASGDTTSQGHIMMPTPIAQEMGLNTFDFAFTIQNSDFDEAKNNRLTSKRLSQDMTYQNQTLNVFINRLDNKIWKTENNPVIPNDFSLLSLPEEIDVSAIYPSYTDENSYIVRIQNLTNSEQNIPKKMLNNGTIVNALEETCIQCKISAYDLVSIKIPYEF